MRCLQIVFTASHSGSGTQIVLLCIGIAFPPNGERPLIYRAMNSWRDKISGRKSLGARRHGRLWGVPDPVEYRDGQGRTFSQYVADQVMTVIATEGKSVRAAADDWGINREVLRSRLNGDTSFKVDELGRIAYAIGAPPSTLTEGFDPQT